MKKIIKTLTFLTIILSSTFISNAQGTFKGTIKYKISAEGRELSAQEKAQMPSEQIIYFSNPYSKADNISAMGGTSSISNSETGEIIILIDMMGQKIAFKGEKNDTTEEKEIEPVVKDLEESKTILGYKCKKYEIIIEGGTKMEAYITEDIDAEDPLLSNFKNIKGFMLEYSSSNEADEDLILNYVATEVKKGKIKKSVFKIPAGYEVKTLEDLKNMMGG